MRLRPSGRSVGCAGSACGRTHGLFIPPALLQSQLDVLEVLEPDQTGTVIDAAGPVIEIAHHARLCIKVYGSGSHRHLPPCEITALPPTTRWTHPEGGLSE